MTKKRNAFLWIAMVLIFIFSVTVFANTEVIEITPPHIDYIYDPTLYPIFETDDRKEYEAFVKQEGIPEDFPLYERVSLFGKFQSASCSDLNSTAVFADYHVTDKNGFTLCVSISKQEAYKGQDCLVIDLEEVEDLSRSPLKSRSSFSYRGFSFYYDSETGDLTSFEFYDAPWLYCVTLAEPYPTKGKDTLMVRLLNPATTDAAIDELYAHLAKTAESPLYRHPLLWLGAGIACGVAATSLVFCFISRKRRKMHTV